MRPGSGMLAFAITAWFLGPLLAIILFALAIRIQRRFIYFPRSYSAAEEKEAKAAGVEKIVFGTSQGKQIAFFWSSRDSKDPPKILWILFAGNGSRALNWMQFLPRLSPVRTGYLMVEYPGYGKCQGHPDPNSILENSEGAYQSLLDQKNWEIGNVRVLGHSLGGAAALQFATRNVVQKIVLISTFTSMAEMVQVTIRIPLGILLRHRFDNVATLKKVLARTPVPEIDVFHGENDALIPVRMGGRLAELDPKKIRFFAMPGKDHNNLIGDALAFALESDEGSPGSAPLSAFGNFPSSSTDL